MLPSLTVSSGLPSSSLIVGFSRKTSATRVIEARATTIETKTIKINYLDKSFELPLQGSLNFEEANLLATPEGTYAFMKKHVPEKIMKTIKVEEYNMMHDKLKPVMNSGNMTGGEYWYLLNPMQNYGVKNFYGFDESE